MNDKIQNYYRTLDLEFGASLEEVKQARRDLAKVWHPDRFPNDPKMQRKANEKLKDINQAYEELETLLAVSEPPPPSPPEPQPTNPKKYPPRHSTTPPPHSHTQKQPEAPPKKKSAWKNTLVNFICLILFLIFVVRAVSSLHIFLHKEKSLPHPVQTAQGESTQPATLTVEELQTKAEKGDADSQFELGDRYFAGKGVAKDEVNAVKWWLKAAEQNNVDAERNLGVSYSNGEGVIQDDVEAVKWYRKAAEQNDRSSEYNLGIHYDLGQGVVQDHVEAVKLYLKSAEQNYADAEYNLGISYMEGQGIAKDYVEAGKWLRKAAEQNNPNAQHALDVLSRH